MTIVDTCQHDFAHHTFEYRWIQPNPILTHIKLAPIQSQTAVRIYHL